MVAGRTRLNGPARILVATGEPLAQMVALALNHGTYVVRIAPDVRATRALLSEWSPHLAVIDIDLAEDGSALDLIGLRRTGGRRLPVIALTLRGDIKTKLAAFERGADDIITVPFSPEELVARVLALMRRTYGEGIPFIPVIRVRELEIDLLTQRVHVGTSRLHLTSVEQAILYLLAANPGKTLTRELILDTVWGADYVAESNIVDRHMRNLRVKLKNSWRQPRYIETVPGQGYRFLVQVREQQATSAS